MATFKLHGETLNLVKSKYADGNTAVLVLDQTGAPYATLSVNLPESKNLGPDAFFIKDYSENKAVAEAVMTAFETHFLNVPPVQSGYVTLYAVVIDPAAFA